MTIIEDANFLKKLADSNWGLSDEVRVKIKRVTNSILKSPSVSKRDSNLVILTKITKQNPSINLTVLLDVLMLLSTHDFITYRICREAWDMSSVGVAKRMTPLVDAGFIYFVDNNVPNNSLVKQIYLSKDGKQLLLRLDATNLQIK